MKQKSSLILSSVITILMLASCGSNDTSETEKETAAASSAFAIIENTVLETSAEETSESIYAGTSGTETSYETVSETEMSGADTSNEMISETEMSAEENSLTILSEEDLSSDAKKFFELVNYFRKKENAEAVIPAKELNECAEKYAGEISNDFMAFIKGYRPDGSDFSTLLDEAGISYTACDKMDGMTFDYDIGLVANAIPGSEVLMAKWKYMGFYYDSEELFWVAVFISDDPADASMPETNTYYYNDAY